jgi:hypothetical protein
VLALPHFLLFPLGSPQSRLAIQLVYPLFSAQVILKSLVKPAELREDHRAGAAQFARGGLKMCERKCWSDILDKMAWLCCIGEMLNAEPLATLDSDRRPCSRVTSRRMDAEGYARGEMRHTQCEGERRMMIAMNEVAEAQENQARRNQKADNGGGCMTITTY